jgi:hypothetical protein
VYMYMTMHLPYLVLTTEAIYSENVTNCSFSGGRHKSI